ncbi:MAG: aldehyde dehydrogenase, partial [Mycobacterium sp.]
MTTTSAETSAPSATLTIGGQPQAGAGASYSVHNPARPAEVVGHAPSADLNQLDAAVQAARRAAAGWRALD